MPRYVQTRPSTHLAKLFTAIRAGNVKVFEEILDKEGLPSARNNADYRLLKKSLVYGHAKMAEILLKRGCRAYRRFDKGNSPLHLAATKHHCSKTVRRLLDHGARVDQKNRFDNTPLHVAFFWAEGNVVDLMLEHHLRNSLANERNAMGLTFLHIAAARKHLENVRCLVEVGNVLVNCQIDKKPDSPFAGFTPLHMAVEFNNLKVAKLLLDNGADLWVRDSQGSTPLHLALERKNVEMMELLFQYDYKRENYVNNFGLSHFMAACVISDPTVCEDYLLNLTNSKTALVKERVDKFANNLAYPFRNYTPLHFAAEYGRQEIVQLLLENGARCRVRNNNVLMPEHLAYGYHQAVDQFVMRVLRHDWKLNFSSLNIFEDEKVDEIMSNDNESGYFDENDNNRSVDYSDSDVDSLDYSCHGSVTDDELVFWEDDIENYML